MESARDYFPGMIVDLEAIVDDMDANGAPVEAIRHVQEAIRICRQYHDRTAFNRHKEAG